MGTYTHLFDTTAEKNTVYNGSGYTEPWVSLVNATGEVDFNRPPIDYSQIPFTIDVLSDGSLTWRMPSGASYSKNGGEWTNIDNANLSISVNQGDQLQFKGTTSGFGSSNSLATNFQFNVCGNIMSWIYGDNFVNKTTLPNSFFQMLNGNSGLISAENLILPATTLCNQAYGRMFENCTNLIKAPELPAETLTFGCYLYLFKGCTKLSYIKCLATNISESMCTEQWTSGVANSGTFIKNPSMSSWTTGVDGIPSGWTIQDAS